MKNRNSFMIALMLVCVVAVSIFVFAGGIKGKSAYQLACENGFTGNVSQWLASLQGKDGEDGKTIDYYALYESAVENGETSATTYLQFIQEELLKNNNSSQEQAQLISIQNSLMSSVSIFSFYGYNAISGSPNISAGSGSIYSIDASGNAYIFTNYHVTYASGYTPEIYVLLYEDSYLTKTSYQEIKASAIPATYIGGDKDRDLAVLKITNSTKLKESDAVAVEFADPDVDLIVGSSCYAVGNPLGEGMSVSDGIISVGYEQVIIEDVTGATTGIVQRAIRTSCKINGGNSGGGLYNSQGKLIGVVNSKAMYSDSNDPVEGISYAIPLKIVSIVVPKIIEQCNGSSITNVTHYTIGISTTIVNCTAEYDKSSGTIKTTEDIAVYTVLADSLTDKLVVGDLLTSVKITYKNGTVLETDLVHYFTLSDLMLTVTAGDKVDISYLRSVDGYYTQEGSTGDIVIRQR